MGDPTTIPDVTSLQRVWPDVIFHVIQQCHDPTVPRRKMMMSVALEEFVDVVDVDGLYLANGDLKDSVRTESTDEVCLMLLGRER